MSVQCENNIVGDCRESIEYHKKMRHTNILEEKIKDAYPFEYSATESAKFQTVFLTGNNPEETRKQLREYFHKTFTLYEFLFKECLTEDASYFKQGTPLRHPLIFYYGHTAAFFINKLMVAGFITERINSHIEFTCAIGVDEMSWDDLNPSHYEWPSVDELDVYRIQVRELVDKLIMETELTGTITWDHPFWIILMGIEHEKIHLETSSVLFRQLPIQVVSKAKHFQPCEFSNTPQSQVDDILNNIAKKTASLTLENKHIINGLDITQEYQLTVSAPELNSPTSTTTHSMQASADDDDSSMKDDVFGKFQMSEQLRKFALETELPSMKPVIGGHLRLGKDLTHHLYGWDNEYGVARVTVADFHASTTLMTNRHYLLFMASGAYSNRNFWSPEGWKFVQFRNATQRPHPEFWVPQFDSNGTLLTYKYRSLCEELDMPWNWPVDLNHLESKALANFFKALTGKSLRLPTEAEWYQLRKFCNEVFGNKTEDENDIGTWEKAPGNINLEYWASSCPVNMFCYENSGFYDVVGNVWQNCEDAMRPYCGFQVHPAYDDFTVPTFDNLHGMIKGGSWISMGNEAAYKSRYAFRRHFYQHAGVRLVESDLVFPETAEKQTTVDDAVVCNAIYDQYYDIMGQKHALKLTQPSVLDITDRVRSIINHVKKESSDIDNILYSGCSTGRGIFELAKYAKKVTGVDFTTRILLPGVELAANRICQYLLPEEGELTSFQKLCLDSNIASKEIQEVAHKVEFIQGDVCNLAHNKFGMYDVIVVTGLDDVRFPERALNNLISHAKPDGLVIVPFTGAYDSATISKEHWLGGCKIANGETIYVKDAITSIITSKGFTTIEIPQLQEPVFVVKRQSKRIYKHEILDILIFKKK